MKHNTVSLRKSPYARTLAALAFASATIARAGEPIADSIEAAPAEAAPAPYAAPFQLRAVMPATVLRLDSAVSFHDRDLSKYEGLANVTIFTAGFKLAPTTGIAVRLPLVYNAPSGVDAPGAQLQVGNAQLLLTHTPFPKDTVRVAFAVAGALPTTAGSGPSPSAEAKATNASAALTRLNMDNMVFLPNDAAVALGTSVAYVSSGLTVQVDATLLNTFKVREAAGDANRTNFLVGLGVAYFITPEVSVGLELTGQHWLSTPAAVAADESLRHTHAALVGGRYHHKFDAGWFRPGVAIAQGLDGPVSTHKEFRVDLPFVF